MKVCKSQKQFMTSSILPNYNETHYPELVDSEVCLFFGRIRNTIVCFRDCLTFSIIENFWPRTPLVFIFYVAKYSFSVTYPPLSANVICESSLIKSMNRVLLQKTRTWQINNFFNWNSFNFYTVFSTSKWCIEALCLI